MQDYSRVEQGPRNRGERRKASGRPAFQVIFAGYDWPGNVREFENVIERTAILTGETFIKLDDLPDNMRECHIDSSSPSAPAVLTLDRVVRAHLEKVLRQTNGNRTKAAEILGTTRRALLRKIEKYSIK